MVRVGRGPLTRRERGSDAEQLAFGYLRERGLRPVHRNFHCRHGEIDLIMLDGDTLVFVEVRFRGGNSFVGAVHTVDARKQRKLVSAASYFLATNRQHSDRVCRFDVAGVRRRDGDLRVEWLKDAFRPGS